MSEGDLLHVVVTDNIGPARRRLGLALIWGSPVLLVLLALAQMMQVWGGYDLGFANWRPTLYAFVLYAAYPPRPLTTADCLTLLQRAQPATDPRNFSEILAVQT